MVLSPPSLFLSLLSDLVHFQNTLLIATFLFPHLVLFISLVPVVLSCEQEHSSGPFIIVSQLPGLSLLHLYTQKASHCAIWTYPLLSSNDDRVLVVHSLLRSVPTRRHCPHDCSMVFCDPFFVTLKNLTTRRTASAVHAKGHSHNHGDSGVHTTTPTAARSKKRNKPSRRDNTESTRVRARIGQGQAPEVRHSMRWKRTRVASWCGCDYIG